MKIENNKIVECTENELFEYYLKKGFDEFYSFADYRQLCEAYGTKVTEEWDSIPQEDKNL